MPRRIVIALLVFVLVPAAATAAPHRAVALYKEEIAKQEYAKALMALHRALRTAQNLSPEHKLDILVAKARFYERYVGDLDESLLILEKARREIPVIDAARKRNIDARIGDVQKIISAHMDVRAFIERLEGLAPKEQKEAIGAIEAFLEKAGARGPYTGALNHFLGVAHLESEELHAAYNAFDEALEISPAIFFRYPTRELKQRAFFSWKQHTLPFVAKLLVSVFLALIALGLFWARPFRWVRWGHLVAAPALIAFWVIAHRALIFVSMSLADDTAHQGGSVIVESHSGAALSSPLTELLFVYGLIAVVAIFLASLAISRIELPMTRYAANVCAGFCITGALMICFVLNHCQTHSMSAKGSRFEHLLSSFRYELTEPIPYLLSSPKDFPGLDVAGIDEVVLRRYFKEMGYTQEGGDE